MKKVLGTGYAVIDIIEDEFEGNVYKALEIKVTDNTIERVKMRAPSSYELLQMTFAQQARNNKQ